MCHAHDPGVKTLTWTSASSFQNAFGIHFMYGISVHQLRFLFDLIEIEKKASRLDRNVRFDVSILLTERIGLI